MEEQHQEKASTRSSISSGSLGGRAEMKYSGVHGHISVHLRGILSLQSKRQRRGRVVKARTGAEENAQKKRWVSERNSSAVQ